MTSSKLFPKLLLEYMQNKILLWQDKQFNSLSAKPTKWLNTLKQFVLPTSCLSVFDHFVGLVLKGLKHL